jgi:hypothetical protein
VLDSVNIDYRFEAESSSFGLLSMAQLKLIERKIDRTDKIADDTRLAKFGGSG